ncbi:chloride channel protein [Desertivirga arenae]|uniref:chloride channel protein n=1 Tax=Desertivirga arenae TaxID=2810309 RepID=UPI001F60B480|nr:chloride channel protein [Pedobacter sp. SYSU D00823]
MKKYKCILLLLKLLNTSNFSKICIIVCKNIAIAIFYSFLCSPWFYPYLILRFDMSNTIENKIPISPILKEFNESDGIQEQQFPKGRILRISALSVLVAFAICIVAKILVSLINLVTNLAFFGTLDLAFRSPATNNLGWFVVIIPVIGGVIVGFMALYGSKAIRGHGIPEAMEQILTNQSKIKPSLAFLKPVSSAIAIGTGGPFGAEGPIIATGGAFGSTLGQLCKITTNERKIILAAGATAGMSAIFGTPIAAVFLAIELLLFEFSPKAILPVALACVTGAAGHHLLFESGPVFPMPAVSVPSNLSLAIYSFMGLTIGFISMGVTKLVYWIEDMFEQLPIHWMWWPALGGLAVGGIGYFHPNTLGVGYNNIIDILSGKLPLIAITTLCLFKFLSWSIALGSGTSGGTLAPLLTIGGATGAILGSLIHQYYPDAGISIPLSALIGMSSMFAGASRAYLTSIAFAVESTMQSNALLPLLGACTGSFMVSLLFMENTIMTEKISRRGVVTPDSYEPDLLKKSLVAGVMRQAVGSILGDVSIAEARLRFHQEASAASYCFLLAQDGSFEGIIERDTLFHSALPADILVRSLVNKRLSFVRSSDTLSKAIEVMGKNEQFILPVIDEDSVRGVIDYKDLITVYKHHHRESSDAGIHIFINPSRLKILMASRKILKG